VIKENFEVLFGKEVTELMIKSILIGTDPVIVPTNAFWEFYSIEDKWEHENKIPEVRMESIL
jgi:hypothetical protein